MTKQSKCKSDQVEKLKTIEDEMFEIGTICKDSFHEYSDIVSLRGAVMSYRCSMQAMRDLMRYSIKK